ncbi:MAG TPA: hypothetical protein VNE00_23440 [Paraburkholderia sp.]|jgi:hypothetical protein|nr:hypothetical protein [Paraburkholderia sp.]
MPRPQVGGVPVVHEAEIVYRSVACCRSNRPIVECIDSLPESLPLLADLKPALQLGRLHALTRPRMYLFRGVNF